MQQGLLKKPREMQQGAPQQGMPQPMEDPAMQGGPMPPGGGDPMMADDAGGEADESHPAFQAAVEFAKTALYQEGAADQVHEVLVKSPDPVEELANIAYEMTSIADEKTEGGVPDELLVLLAGTMLEEVAGIAEASGIQLQPSDIAGALKNMILRWVGEQGHDTRQLQEAMDRVSPEEINRLAAEEGAPGEQPAMPPQGGQMPQQQVPQQQEVMM